MITFTFRLKRPICYHLMATLCTSFAHLHAIMDTSNTGAAHLSMEPSGIELRNDRSPLSLSC